MKKKLAKRFGAVTLATVMGVAPVTAMAASDISGHWAEADINTWLNAGWISGFPDGTMKPNDVVTRAQFVMMLNNILGLTTKGSATFTDVPAGSWFSDAVSIAVAAGYAAGMSDTTFAPDSTVTREQAASFVARAIGATNSGDISQYTDTAAISSWARDAVGSMSTSGYLSGMPDGSFDPQAGLTRAQAVSFLERVRKDHGVSNVPTTDTAALVIDKTGTVIENQTIDGDVIVASTVREGDVYFKNVTITGDLLIQGGGSNSIYLEDCTVNGRVIMDKANVRLELSGNTVINTIEVLKVCHIDSKNFTGNVGLINFATNIANSDGYVVVDVDADEISIDAVVKVEINGEIGKVHVTSNGAGSTVNTGKGSEIGTLVADGKVTITGSGVINKLETNVEGVVVGGNVDVENEVVADGVGGSSSDNTGTSSGGSTSTGTIPWWDGDDDDDDDKEPVAPTPSNSIKLEKLLYATATEGEELTPEQEAINAKLKAYIGIKDDFTTATTLVEGDAVALSVIKQNDTADITFISDLDETEDREELDALIEEHGQDFVDAATSGATAGITATDGNNYYVRWQITNVDDQSVVNDGYNYSGILECKSLDINGLEMLGSDNSKVDEPLVFVARDDDKTITIKAQLVKETQEGEVSAVTSTTVDYTFESKKINTYSKLKNTIESLNADDDADSEYLKENILEYTYNNPVTAIKSMVSYSAYVIPIDENITNSDYTSIDDYEVINYTGTTPIIFVPADGAGETIKIDGLNISSPNAPISINANVEALAEENMLANGYAAGSEVLDVNYNEGELVTDVLGYSSNATLEIGKLKLDSKGQTFASNSTIDQLTIKAAKEVIANDTVKETIVLAGAGAGSGNVGSYGNNHGGFSPNNPGTQVATPMTNAVWLRSFGEAYAEPLSSSIIGSEETVYQTVRVYEDTLISADVDVLVSETSGVVVDIMTRGLVGDTLGDSTVVYDQTKKIATIDKVEAKGDVAVIGAGRVNIISVVEFPAGTSKSKPVHIQIETAGNYEIIKATADERYNKDSIIIDEENIQVGYVAGSGYEDDYIYAFGGLVFLAGEEDTEDYQGEVYVLGEVLEFLATPDFVYDNYVVANGGSIDVDWVLNNTALTFGVNDDNNPETTTTYYQIDNEEPVAVTGSSVTIADAIEEAIAIRASDYTKADLQAINSITGLADDLKNNGDEDVTIELYTMKNAEAEETAINSSSATDKSTVVEVNVTFKAPLTNHAEKLDGAYKAGNTFFAGSNYYGVPYTTVADTIKPVAKASNGGYTLSEIFKLTDEKHASMFQLEEGEIVNADGKYSSKDIYVYLANDNVTAFQTALSDAMDKEIAGTLSTQEKLDTEAGKIFDAIELANGEDTMLQVNELFYEYTRYSTAVELQTGASGPVYTTPTWNDYESSVQATVTVETQQDVEDLVQSFKDAYDKLGTITSYQDTTALQTYFETNGAWLQGELKEADYTAESWAEFDAIRKVFVGKNFDYASDKVMAAAVEVLTDSIAALVGNLSLDAGQLNRAGELTEDTMPSYAYATAKEFVEAVAYGAEYLNERYIYTGVEAPAETFELSTLTKVDGETTTNVNMYTQKITISGPDDLVVGPATLYLAEGGTDTQVDGTGDKYFIKTTSPVEYASQTDEVDLDDNYNYWVNLRLENIAVGATDLTDVETKGFLANDWANEELGEAGFDTYANITQYIEYIDGSSVENEFGKDEDNIIPIYIPVDREDIGGEVSTEDYNGHILHKLNQGNATAYYYIQVPESTLKLNYITGESDVNLEITVPESIIKLEIEFKAGEWYETTEEYATEKNTTWYETLYGAETPTGQTDRAGMLLEGALTAYNVGMFAAGGDPNASGSLTVNAPNSSDDPTFSWNITGPTSLTPFQIAELANEEEEEIKRTPALANELNEDRPAGADLSMEGFEGTESEITYVDGALNMPEGFEYDTQDSGVSAASFDFAVASIEE